MGLSRPGKPEGRPTEEVRAEEGFEGRKRLVRPQTVGRGEDPTSEGFGATRLDTPQKKPGGRGGARTRMDVVGVEAEV